MPYYINPFKHDLYLMGPDGVVVRIQSGMNTLPAYFKKYIANKLLQDVGTQPVRSVPVRSVPVVSSVTSRRTLRPPRETLRPSRVPIRPFQTPTKIVGYGSNNSDLATEICKQTLAVNHYPISNDIGVGILTYNRPDSLRCLINSIVAHTDLSRTTIFISDDGSTNTTQLALLDELLGRDDIVVLRNTEQIGVAGNSNRLLRCLGRFKHKLLLNDDVEIINVGWDRFYFDAMVKTGMHHFCYRQAGIYGAAAGDAMVVRDVKLEVVNEKPQGAVLALDADAIAKIGFFDTGFGQYGVEHVDWSTRLYKSGLQRAGFFDVCGSADYFRLHNEVSAVKDRVDKLAKARKLLADMPERSYVPACSASVVPVATCVIPFRVGIDRYDAINTVIGNIKAQRYPCIEIILSEEDTTSKWPQDSLTYRYVFTGGKSDPSFNKSAAWNAGVAMSTSTKLILHDADMLAPASYFAKLSTILDEHEACHIGSRVLYIDKSCTEQICKTDIVDSPICDRIVTYFQGGSLGCRTDAYWRIGGFAECFVGYGVEDVDFFIRVSGGTRWCDNRTVDLIHLWHGRTPGWGDSHAGNKRLGEAMNKLSIADRITAQRRELKNSPWSAFVS